MLCGKLNYKELEIYQLAHDFTLHIYAVCTLLPAHELNNLTSQLRRAATCLPLNIAEGSGSASYRALFNYLIFCYRSCLETEAALRLCKDLGYISAEQHQVTHAKMDLFIRKLYRYMQYVETKTDRRGQGPFYGQGRQGITADMARRECAGTEAGTNTVQELRSSYGP
jgi:four helix bundle protein